MARFKLYILAILGLLLFVGGAVLSVIVIKTQPQVIGLSRESEITSLIFQIGKLMVLPADEMPTVTTIDDVSKVNGQPFFKNAKNGDKLLVYTNAKWAVMYRPSENRIIEVGAFDAIPTPVSTPIVSPTAVASPSPTVIPTVLPTLVASPAAH